MFKFTNVGAYVRSVQRPDPVLRDKTKEEKIAKRWKNCSRPLLTLYVFGAGFKRLGRRRTVVMSIVEPRRNDDLSRWYIDERAISMQACRNSPVRTPPARARAHRQTLYTIQTPTSTHYVKPTTVNVAVLLLSFWTVTPSSYVYPVRTPTSTPIYS